MLYVCPREWSAGSSQEWYMFCNDQVVISLITYSRVKAVLDFPEDILYRSDHELASIIKIPEAVAKTLKSTAASTVYGWEQQRICASDLLDLCDQPERITIGDATIDVVLGGGVVTRGITEVVGQRYTYNGKYTCAA